MNNLIELKGNFQHISGNRPGDVQLPAGENVDETRINTILEQLKRVNEFWEKEEVFFDPLIEVHYKTIVAKSNRIEILLFPGKGNNMIVGAYYDGPVDNRHHVITYRCSLKSINDSIEILKKVKDILSIGFDGIVVADTINNYDKESFKSKFSMPRYKFIQVLRDVSFVSRIVSKQSSQDVSGDVLVNIYDVGFEDTQTFLFKLGFDINRSKIFNNTVLLSNDEYLGFSNKFPYLISMATKDFIEFIGNDFIIEQSTQHVIKEPEDEPVVGVIDTHFSDDVYFSDWVEYHDMSDEGVEVRPEDRYHGTAVASLIVDGPGLNPDYDDGCGYFRVKLFGVAEKAGNSSFSLMKKINDIVEANRDIKVWNISLGSDDEISQNFISPGAAILDDLQYKFKDIIFVIAGTNKTNNQTFIGSPADSINSLVVNSVDYMDNISSYSRRGPVLSFYKKPDVSCFGGDINKRICISVSEGDTFSYGTSFATPWITRKMAYLMYKMKFSREISKALIIDSASKWDCQDNLFLGYGIVPTKISDVINSNDDEIKFFIYETCEKKFNYNFNIPVPTSPKGFPFCAKATLCYMPKCDLYQGVDYACSELSLSFGRINLKGSIASIKKTKPDANLKLTEKTMRKNYRKWDNTKHVQEKLSSRTRAKKVYKTNCWGLKIEKIERLPYNYADDMKYGIVVTLKEIEGKNRIHDFIRQCSMRGWIVNPIDIENRVKIAEKEKVEIKFD